MSDTPTYRVAPGADISEDATIGDRSSIWHL
ncbi:carbonic anhydrase/acetyltransferase-like protein (isoleucine patch superfamily) [Brachybacterium muris]|nr:carbonic anhydrase/acetyltransferase-like protein (isoleucine patch superfamily) [Brachybacterium muris]